jgi:hypothetical protein
MLSAYTRVTIHLIDHQLRVEENANATNRVLPGDFEAFDQGFDIRRPCSSLVRSL